MCHSQEHVESGPRWCVLVLTQWPLDSTGPEWSTLRAPRWERSCFKDRLPFFFFSFIFISWRLITSQHCSGFCHTLTWTSHGVTCVPHPDSPFHLPLHPIPLGLPSAPGRALVSRIPPGLVICFTINNIHAVLSKHPTLAFSHRVQKSVLYKRSAILCS